MGRFINPFTDYGFKKIFGQEVSKPLLIDFLNSLLVGERVITDLKFLNNEQLRGVEDDRSLIYDIYCQTDTGEQIIVEMQNREQLMFKNRALYYQCEAIARQGIKGTDWQFDIKAVYGVYFMNFKLAEIEALRTDVILADRATGELFNPNFRQVFITLPLFCKSEGECETDFERWIYVLKNMETLERMPFKARKAVFDKLEQVVDVASMNREEYDIYWRSLNAYRTNLSVQAAALQNGMERGRAEGRAEGIKENNLRNVRLMRAKKFSDEDIASILDLSLSFVKGVS